MWVSDQIRKSVAFLFYNQDGIKRVAGTATLVGVESTVVEGTSFSHWVTCKHVIAACKTRATDGRVWIRYNRLEGGAGWIDVASGDWYDHPTDSSVDVSVLPWDDELASEMDVLYLPTTVAATAEVVATAKIGVGDELFLTGIFTGNYSQEVRNVPVVRVGNIAAMPEEKVATRYFGRVDAYLAEVRSIGGLSGSPVFVNMFSPRAGKFTVGGPAFYWLGIMHGHWDQPAALPSHDALEDEPADEIKSRERVNTGIGIVIPVDRVLEVINHPALIEERERIEREIGTARTSDGERDARGSLKPG